MTVVTVVTAVGVDRWQEVVESHGAALYRLAVRLAGDTALAQELVLRAFTLLHADGVCGEPADVAARLRRSVVENFRASPAARKMGGPSAAGGIDQALARLPADLRAAAVLHDVEGLAAPEAAAMLGIDEVALYRRLRWAREQLRIPRAPDVSPALP